MIIQFVLNANPIKYPTPTAKPPNPKDSNPNMYLFKPTSIAFAKPRLKSSKAPIIVAITVY